MRLGVDIVVLYFVHFCYHMIVVLPSYIYIYIYIYI